MQNVNTNFKFRSKFKKLLTPENQEIITNAFRYFCNLDSDTARKILWRMTYSSDTASQELYKLGLNAIISSENILVLRNELRTQFEKGHSNFLQPALPEECKLAFSELKNHTDAIVVSIIFDHCYNTLKEAELSRALYLLSNEKDNYYFGGLKSLNFNNQEAEYLKPFHVQIHDLLKSIYIFFENCDKKIISTIEEEKQEVGKEEVQVESMQDQEEIPVKRQFRKLTPEAILENIEFFSKAVINEDVNLVLFALRNQNFDLNEVMEKEGEIRSLIFAAYAFNK